MRLTFFVLGVVILAAPAVSQQRLALDGQEFNEVLRESAQVSGVVVSGAVALGDPIPLDGQVIVQSVLPADWAGEAACLQIVSRDGLYESLNQYRIPETWSGGLVDIPFPTNYEGLLEDGEPDSLAARLIRGACRAPAGSTAVAYLHGFRPDADVRIFVNSFRAHEVFAYFGDQAVRCEPIETEDLVAFDTLCPVPPDLEGEIEVTLFRLTDGTAAPPTFEILELGGRR